MTRPRCGKVTFLQSYQTQAQTESEARGVPCPTQTHIHIDGQPYTAYRDSMEKFSDLKTGDLVEFTVVGKCAHISAVQCDLLPRPEAANLFNMGGE